MNTPLEDLKLRPAEGKQSQVNKRKENNPIIEHKNIINRRKIDIKAEDLRSIKADPKTVVARDWNIDTRTLKRLKKPR